MGKSKKRIIARAKHDKNPFDMTRIDAVKAVCETLLEDVSNIEAKKLITLFGLTADELAEGGLSYESLRSLDCEFS